MTQTYDAHQDDLFSVLALSDANGVVAQRYNDGDYGNRSVLTAGGLELDESAALIPHGYTGRLHHPDSGLIEYRYRWLLPETGSFVQRDPLGYVDTPSLHNYVRSSPYVFTDALGLQPTRWDIPSNYPGDMQYQRIPTKMLIDLYYTTACVLIEPLDWIDTGCAIVRDPGNKLNYCGLIPLIPARPVRMIPDLLKPFSPSNLLPRPAQRPKKWIEPIYDPMLPWDPRSFDRDAVVRVMPPNSLYPNGYWRCMVRDTDDIFYYIDPVTGFKSQPGAFTHIRLPSGTAPSCPTMFTPGFLELIQP